MKLSIVAATILYLGLSAGAQAAEYPTRPITVIVPFPPGGATDVTARLTTQKMQGDFPQQFIIDNRPGANGSIGAGQLARAEPDGYTVMVGSIGVIAINPALYKNLSYDPGKNFDLLTVAVRNPNVLVTRPDFPANTVGEMIEHLKKNPDRVTFASSGVGSSDHLTAVLFWQKTGTKGVHTPYKGGAPAHTDMMGSHVDASFQNLGAVANYVREGKMKILGVTSEARIEAFPNTPTMKEAGVEDLEVYSWQAFVAPKGLPADVKERLLKSMTTALSTPDLKKRYNDLGFEVVANTPDEFSRFLEKELARWKVVVETGKIMPSQ